MQVSLRRFIPSLLSSNSVVRATPLVFQPRNFASTQTQHQNQSQNQTQNQSQALQQGTTLARSYFNARINFFFTDKGNRKGDIYNKRNDDVGFFQDAIDNVFDNWLGRWDPFEWSDLGRMRDRIII